MKIFKMLNPVGCLGKILFLGLLGYFLYQALV